MPTRPSSSRIVRASNTSRTRPLPLCTRSWVPLAVAMPAASWPRCWSTVSPSYSAVATSVVATMPMMPHMMRFPLLWRVAKWWRDGRRSRMRADDAVEARAGLELRLEPLGVLAGRHRAGLDPGQAPLVGVHGVGECSHAQVAQAIAQAGGIGGAAEGANLDRESDPGSGNGRRGPG